MPAPVYGPGGLISGYSPDTGTGSEFASGDYFSSIGASQDQFPIRLEEPVIAGGAVFGGTGAIINPVTVGAAVGAITGAVSQSQLPVQVPGIPGGQYSFGDILPGGTPFRTPDLPSAEHQAVKRWTTNGGQTVWVRDNHNHVFVFNRRKGTWTKVKKKRATVIGNQLTVKNLNKALKVLDRFKGKQKSLKYVIPGGK